MTVEELNAKLFEKMSAEQLVFIEAFKNSPSKESILDAYELVIREDILLYLEENDLDAAQCKALLKEKEPLSKLFLAWEKHEGRHMEEIGDCVEHFVNELVKQVKERKHSECR